MNSKIKRVAEIIAEAILRKKISKVDWISSQNSRMTWKNAWSQQLILNYCFFNMLSKILKFPYPIYFSYFHKKDELM